MKDIKKIVLALLLIAIACLDVLGLFKTIIIAIYIRSFLSIIALIFGATIILDEVEKK